MLKKLTKDEAIKYSGLPTNVFEVILWNECLCFGDVSANVVHSIAVFSISAVSESDAILRYIGVEEQNRFMGQADSLLKFASECLISMKIRGIFIKLNEDAGELMGHHEFLCAEHFIPVCTKGRCLHYSLGEIEKAEGYRQIDQNLSKLPKTEPVKGWDDPMLRRFLNRNRDNGLFISKDSHDAEYSRVYKNEGDIQAAIFISRQNEIYVMSQLFWEKEVFAQTVLPSLIGGCIKELINQESDQKLDMYVYDDTVYKGILSLFSSPECENKVFEYYRPIR